MVAPGQRPRLQAGARACATWSSQRHLQRTAAGPRSCRPPRAARWPDHAGSPASRRRRRRTSRAPAPTRLRALRWLQPAPVGGFQRRTAPPSNPPPRARRPSTGSARSGDPKRRGYRRSRCRNQMETLTLVSLAQFVGLRNKSVGSRTPSASRGVAPILAKFFVRGGRREHPAVAD